MRVRRSITELEGYGAGRKAPGATLLASNESPFGLLPAVRQVLVESGERAFRYPDPAATALVDALADRHGVSRESLALGGGSVELCAQLVHALVDPGDEVVFAWRSFEAYPIVTTIGGGVDVRIPLRDHTHDLERMAAAVTSRTRVVIVCNPNNPTSTAVGRAAIEHLLAAVPDDVLVVIDEAYHEYTDPDAVPDGLQVAREQPNVAVLRTFSKAYALAGFRVGWCHAPEPIAAALRKVQTPFSVSTMAQAAAVAALTEEEEVSRRAAAIVGERERVISALRDAGYVVPPSQANFVWLALDEHAVEFGSRCVDAGIIVRPFADAGVRVTIGLPEENDRFLDVATELASIFAKGG